MSDLVAQCLRRPPERDRWTLHVHFDDLETQRRRDGELAFPNDEASLFIAEIRRVWHLLPEELQELATWTDRCVVVEVQVLDMLEGLLPWLTMHTVFTELYLTRADDEEIMT